MGNLLTHVSHRGHTRPMPINAQIRIDRKALDRWKEVVGMGLDDGAAANAAVNVAADLAQREAEALARGMQWLADWAARGLVDMQALRGGDVEIRVEGSEVCARIGDAHFGIGSNPTLAKTAVKVAKEAAS